MHKLQTRALVLEVLCNEKKGAHNHTVPVTVLLRMEISERDYKCPMTDNSH